jgi:thioredoxin reductase
LYLLKGLMKKKYDVAIIGAGVAGCFAALKIQENYTADTIVFDIGKRFAKRRRQLEGAIGCFPNSDGKLYLNNFEHIKTLVDGRSANASKKWVDQVLSEAGNLKILKDNKVANDLLNRAEAHKFKFIKNDHIQWKPEQIHKLSKNMVQQFEDSGHVSFSFDNEVHQILKKKNAFLICSNDGEVLAKNIIFCPGRTGWRWANDFYKNMGIEVQDDYAKFGVRFEISGQYIKELNKSHGSFVRPDLEVGPFSWNGTIMPEDHADLVCSTFRSNEERWHSEKVSFSLIANVFNQNNGVKQTERMANLSYLLFNDRVSKEKVKVFLKKNSQLNYIPEYNWLENAINELGDMFPNLISKGYYFVPNILPLPGKISLDKNLCSEIDGLYVAGEAGNVPGIYGAALSGAIAANSACKDLS